MKGQRWPKRVYGCGDEPDYRFSFANERTFLAWIRTALALIAAGVALDVVRLSISEPGKHLVALTFVGLGLAAAMGSWFRWASSERAIRRNEALPAFGLSAVIAGIVALAAIVIVTLSL